jgi:hypothetical protein
VGSNRGEPRGDTDSGLVHITDNAIIPLKERVVDRFYDPVSRLLRMVTG